MHLNGSADCCEFVRSHREYGRTLGRSGFLCYCVDLQHPAGKHREGNIVRVGADIREWPPPYAKTVTLFAFPPCTDVAVSGARWFKDKGLGSLSDALAFPSQIDILCLAVIFLFLLLG